MTRAATALIVALAVATPAIAGPADRALDYLAGHQGLDGGFSSGAPGESRSAQAYTDWAALAVAAAGERASGWSRGPRTLEDAVRRRAGRGREIGDITRGVVSLVAVGANPRVVRGRDLVAEILALQAADPTLGGRVIDVSWAALALRAAGSPPGAPELEIARSALAGLERPGGGWGSGPGDGVDAVSTAAGLHALAAAGVPAGDPVVVRARRVLRGAQTAEGGFAATSGARADALTTGWVSIALTASGEDPGGPAWRRGGGPLSYLARLQRRDGSIAYRPGQIAAPNWVSAQAVLALRRRLLPLRAGRAAAPRRAPVIVGREPAAGAPAARRVIVRYRDDALGTGVDPASVRLAVNGRDVTGLARVSPFALQLDDLPVEEGAARLRLDLADRSGNRRTFRWTLGSAA